MSPLYSSPALNYKWSIGTCIYHPPLCLKDNGVITLTFWGHVTSSVTCPFDLRWPTSYGWSIVTMHLSGTVMEIMAPQMLDARTDGRTHGRSGDFILCPMQCIGQIITAAVQHTHSDCRCGAVWKKHPSFAVVVCKHGTIVELRCMPTADPTVKPTSVLPDCLACSTRTAMQQHPIHLK